MSQLRNAERLVLYYLPPLFCMGLIFYLSSLSWVRIPLPGWVIMKDKIVHAVMYAFLCFLWVRAFRAGDGARMAFVFYAAAIVITVVYGISDEIHQAHVPGRSSTVGDGIADSVGAVLAGGILYIWQTEEPSRTTQESYTVRKRRPPCLP